nr:reverse transcriptase domain-containing protein [Tanacetum cinerariifolium]
MSNQTNELKNMMARFFQMNTASTSGSESLPTNTIANPKGELKAITTRSGIVLDGHSVPIPPLFINPNEDERVEETLTDQDLVKDPLHPNIPYPSRMLKQKQQEKDEVQIYKFWQMFKKLHINITLADALILIPKYQKMIKALLFNKEKLLELANTPLNENCSSIILKKLPEKLGDPRKFLIPCGFSELKCKALADLVASINLMPLSVWKKLGLPELISTRMTFELANRAICTPARIARDVFVPVGKFTFPANFVIIDYESDPRVPLILGRPFLQIARALIDGGNVLPEKLLDLYSTKDLHSPHNVNPLSGSTTSSSPNHLLEEFVGKLAPITFPPRNDNLPFDIEFDLKEIEYLLHHDLIKDTDSILEDSIDEDNLVDLNDNLVDTMLEMFTKEHALDYSSPLLYDEYDDDLFEVESYTEYVYDDPFKSKGEKIKESKLLIDELDLPSDFFPPFKYDSFLSKDFSKVDAFLQPTTRTSYLIQMDEEEEDDGVNDNEDEAEVINAYEEFGKNFQVGESRSTGALLEGNSEIHLYSPIGCNLEGVRMVVIRLDKKMLDRGRIPAELRFERESSIYTAYAPRVDDDYAMVRDADMAA